VVIVAFFRRTRSKSTFELAAKYGTIDFEYESLNPLVADNAIDIPKGAPHFIETEQALLDRCATTLDRILEFTLGENFAIVSHAPCAQALALHLEGKGIENSRLGAWPLGGVSKFSRMLYSNNSDGNTSYGPWAMEFYGDTEHMPGKYQVGAKVRAKKLSYSTMIIKCQWFLMFGCIHLYAIFLTD
jgi:Histidine phosphatase superfamily (branch 1)